MAAQYDVVVIGTGAAGAAAATRCRKDGWSVAVVDDQPYGGTCALRGCDPKKVLVAAADVVDWQRRMMGFGVATARTKIDWPALMRFKRGFTDPVPADRESAFRSSGIDTYHGVARFVAPDRLFVGQQALQAEHFVIASGAMPRRLDIPGEEQLKTSTDFLELEQLPQRILVVGAGYIAFEFAHIAARAEAQVVIVGRGRALAKFDQDLVTRLVDHTVSLGVDIRLNSSVTKISSHDFGTCVEFHGTKGTEVLQADCVVHAAGRVPKTRQLELQSANVEVDDRGAVKTNEFLQSISNPRVYAAGDAALPPGSLPLTPVASHEGLIVASNLLHGNTKRPDYRGIPSTVFTIPSLSRVGMTEADAREHGLTIRVQSEDTSHWFSNRHVRANVAAFKTIVEERTDRVLGAHILGQHAEEVINVFALAIRNELPARALKQMIFAYPTSASDIAYML